MEEKNIYEELIASDGDFVKVILPAGVQIEVKTAMTMEEKSAFVDRVAESVFDVEGDYRPEYIEPIFEISLLQMLTDVPVFEDEDGASIDIDKTYQLCKTLDVRHQVDNKDFNVLVGELRELVYEKIEFEKNRIIAGEREKLEIVRNEMEDGLAMINTIAESLLKNVEEMGNIDNYVAEIARFNDNTEKMSEDELVNSVLEFKK